MPACFGSSVSSKRTHEHAFLDVPSRLSVKRCYKPLMQVFGMLQVQATFAGGLQEHLQAAGGANAATAASLRESLGTAAQILNDLKFQKGETTFCLM